MSQKRKDIFVIDDPLPKREWPDPTPTMLNSLEFKAIWQVIKSWDIAVPDMYSGYCGATGNHVRAILDALNCNLVGCPIAVPHFHQVLGPASNKKSKTIFDDHEEA